jgi:hypothetical protein
MRKPAARDRPIVVAIPAQARKSWAESILRPSKSGYGRFRDYAFFAMLITAVRQF